MSNVRLREMVANAVKNGTQQDLLGVLCYILIELIQVTSDNCPRIDSYMDRGN